MALGNFLAGVVCCVLIITIPTIPSAGIDPRFILHRGKEVRFSDRHARHVRERLVHESPCSVRSPLHEVLRGGRRRAIAVRELRPSEAGPRLAENHVDGPAYRTRLSLPHWE